MINLDGANETDVREEIATPILKMLGYARGTSADIAREPSLIYDRQFLGRKKPSDPPLRGRADYILSVVGAARWVLEIKGPDEPIDVDAIEQAISYARHPEVSALYAVILNGRRITIHHATQRAVDGPLLDLELFDVEAAVNSLIPVLSPAAIRRDARLPKIDLGKPLAEGLRSLVGIVGGEIVHHELQWHCNFAIPQAASQNLDEMCRRVRGLQVAITGGSIWRDANSRVRAKLTWAHPHDEVLQFAIDKRLMDNEYMALSDEISGSAENPTVFDVVGHVRVDEGETLFDIVSWSTKAAGLDTHMRYVSSATGFLRDYMFNGSFRSVYYSSFPSAPGLEIEMHLEGSFKVHIDRQ